MMLRAAAAPRGADDSEFVDANSSLTAPVDESFRSGAVPALPGQRGASCDLVRARGCRGADGRPGDVA
eukprot:SAG31_NODE_150_length_22290_cov_5.975801_30_plen_68_part_00